MIALWPHWLRPFWLLLLPLFGWLLWRLWHREQRSGRWQMLLPPAFHDVLLSGGRGRNSRLPWVALGLAWLLALLALLGPSWQRTEQVSQKRSDPLVVLLELTPEMLATDATPNRLAQARRKLLDLLEARSEAQTAIVVYAGSAHTLVPLSYDHSTARNLLDALKPSIMPEPGRRADLAVAQALALLEQGAQGRGRLLLIASSLDERERQGIRQALDRHSSPLLILGVGTPQGAPIALEGGGFLKDDQGAILLPRLDESGLQRFAGELHGRYAQARIDEADLRQLGLLDMPQGLREDGEVTQLALWADQGHWLLLPLLLIAACAGRRGWLFCLPLLWVLPQPVFAFGFDDLWLRPDQQGQRLLEAQRPAEAARRFEDPRWQGQALYRAGDYPAAAERFAQGSSAADHYNRGNALARSGELEEAIDAYDAALERQPDLSAAQKNKALVEELLRQRQQEKSQNPGQGSPSPEAQPGEQAPPESTPSTAPPSSDAREKPPARPAGDAAPADTAPTDAAGPQPTPKDAAQPPDDEETTQRRTLDDSPLDGERRQALEQWLRQIPDDPAELLRRKFWYEQKKRQENQP
ncbi:VWA domain-containing protein [Pseudomonas sp. PS02288]|uniref:VWA domain-containing protein n=1 Tax=Pseudomonas sp. PS02288 TaxID=2991443 RepID=UPI00249C1F0C|nr:VWA domain-containing protein [Pseudomonas sp. PS02288]